MAELSLTTNRVLAEVLAERTKQDARWGQQNHPDGTGAALPPAFRGIAPMARQLCDMADRSGMVTWRHILMEEFAEVLEAEDTAALRAELLQVSAVAAAWVEAIDRRAGA